jgi:hypothetical protein
MIFSSAMGLASRCFGMVTSSNCMHGLSSQLASVRAGDSLHDQNNPA